MASVIFAYLLKKNYFWLLKIILINEYFLVLAVFLILTFEIII